MKRSSTAAARKPIATQRSQSWPLHIEPMNRMNATSASASLARVMASMALGTRHRQCQPLDLLGRNAQLHAEQCRGEDLSLRVRLQRQRAAAVERAVQQEVERVQIRQLEALHISLDHAEEVF